MGALAASSVRTSKEVVSARLRRGDALIMVDVRNDFLPGGVLAVPGGEKVILPLNRYIREFEQLGLPVFATRDWHPRSHCSFREQGGPPGLHTALPARGARSSTRNYGCRAACT